MTTKRFAATLSFVVLAAAATAAPAVAQVVSAGPYYAKPSWDQTLPCETAAGCTRFIVLSNMNSDAVLDRETGLVWERAPSDVVRAGNIAAAHCTNRVVGNRQGWRLPTIQELKSLIDPSATLPALPPGHPFTNLVFGAGLTFEFYWSASVSGTTIIPADNLALINIGVLNATGSAPRTGTVFGRAWCVRGGQGALLQ